MTYFKVDDHMWGHPKFALLSNDAVSLWVTAGSWSCAYLTDGLVPFQSLPVVRGSKQAAQELVDAKLWDMTPDGYVFHDWLVFQDSKEYVSKKNAAARERMRRYRLRQAGVSDANVDDEVTSEVTRNVTSNDDVVFSVCSGKEGKEGKDSSSSSFSSKSKDDEFDSFWKVYPRREGKQAARKAWVKAVALADALDIIAGAERFRDDPNREPEFTPHPATWLNAGRWEDDPLPPRGGQARSKSDALMDWAKAQDAHSGANALEGYSDTPDDISSLSVAPGGNYDDFDWEAR